MKNQVRGSELREASERQKKPLTAKNAHGPRGRGEKEDATEKPIKLSN